MTMINIIPIRADFILKVRNTNLDDQNQSVIHMTAKGGEPCRDILRAALPGEKIILASYCPFKKAGPYKEYGPIYISNQALNERPNLTRFPFPVGKDTDYLGNIFVLRAYNLNEDIVDAELVSVDDAETVLNRFWSNSSINFVLVRFAAYGCYAFRLERPYVI